MDALDHPRRSVTTLGEILDLLNGAHAVLGEDCPVVAVGSEQPTVTVDLKHLDAAEGVPAVVIATMSEEDEALIVDAIKRTLLQCFSGAFSAELPQALFDLANGRRS